MDHQFAYTEEQLAEVAHDLIAQAHAAGASDVKVSLSEMAGLSVEVTLATCQERAFSHGFSR